MMHPNPTLDHLLRRLADATLPVIDLSLARMERLLALLGHPEQRLPPVVHVAGTNGKGSLLALLGSAFAAAGWRAHRYISPHLVQFNERIILNGRMIDDAALLQALLPVAEAAAECPVTFFEATTAASFLAFAACPTDMVLLETGLGGRLDATNTIAKPVLTAITPISYDHMEYLGTTLADIAREKAGILKTGVPCVVGPQPPEALAAIENAAEARGAPLFRHGKEWEVTLNREGFCYRSARGVQEWPMPALPGAHQAFNAGTMLACLEHLHAWPVPEAAIRRGLATVAWPARLQRLTTGALAGLLPEGATLWLDGGHNPAAAQALAHWAATQPGPIHVIMGMLASKEAKPFLSALLPYAASFTAVPIAGEACYPPATLAALAARRGLTATAKEGVRAALCAVPRAPGIVLICGSLYLAGQVLTENTRALHVASQ